MQTLETFLHTYQHLNKDNLDSLKDIYSDDVQFIDPAHEIQGLDNLQHYFQELYQNARNVQFSFSNTSQSGHEAFVEWEMAFNHPKLSKGRQINVPGVSRLRFNESGKVMYHRDFFDLGAMLYERLPLIGSLISFIKRRLGK